MCCITPTTNPCAQIEGAIDRAGKSPSIWDTFVKVPGKIRGGGTGDTADDFFHTYREDIALMKDMGVQMHRLVVCGVCV